MNIETISNYKKIEEIVTNHFSLDKESLQKFKTKLFNQKFDKAYTDLVNNEDLRLRIPLNPKDMEDFDEGWKQFKQNFKSFNNITKITYKDFIKGIIKKNKQQIKLSRAIIEFYINNKLLYEIDIYPNWLEIAKHNKYDEEESSFHIKNVINNLYKDISGLKFSEKTGNLSIVLSLNFADWFLSSTQESWTSCLNLESSFSGSYWTGLPGMITDKNRALIYFTNGEKKEYHGIISDRIIKRSWIILDVDDIFHIIKFFPSRMDNIDLINRKFGKNWSYVPIENTEFCSKYDLDFLNFESGDSCFIYQDNTRLKKIVNKYYFIGAPDDGGYYHLNENNEMSYENIFSFSEGFSFLRDKNLKISRYFLENTKICCSCDVVHSTDDDYMFDGYHYCYQCYKKLFKTCLHCGEVLEASKMIYLRNNDGYDREGIMCFHCYQKLYFVCIKCRVEEKVEEKVITDSNETICRSCSTA